jgi:prevent-host-death family protein
MDGRWQLQEAKQRFSELIRSVEVDGPQFVTRHGEEVAVVIDIVEYRRLRGDTRDLKEFLQFGPHFDVLEIDRPANTARVVDFGEGV